MKLQPSREFELDAQPGLPEPLPSGERILWQGTPDRVSVARRVFHLRKVAMYFGLLLVWAVAARVADGSPWNDVVAPLAWLLPLFAVALGMLALLARWTASTTAYTLTDRRVVMRVGIVLTVAYNLPLKRIDGADLQSAGDGCHDVALRLETDTRIAWLQLWPHVRPWSLRKPQPMLRSLRDGERVAALLSRAWRDANGAAAAAASSTTTVAASSDGARSRPEPVIVAAHA